MQTKYYTPALEDLCHGYVCEFRRKIFRGILYSLRQPADAPPEFCKDWESGAIGLQHEPKDKSGVEMLWASMQNTILPLPYYHEAVDLLKYMMLRTPYLTREQIESEGWVFQRVDNHEILFKKEIERKHRPEDEAVIVARWFTYNPHSCYLQLRSDPFSSEDIAFKGFIPSINEFRKIINLTKFDSSNGGQ